MTLSHHVCNILRYFFIFSSNGDLRYKWVHLSFQLNSKCWAILRRGRDSQDYGGLRWFVAAGEQWRAVVQPLETSWRGLGKQPTSIPLAGTCVDVVVAFTQCPAEKASINACLPLNLALVVCSGPQHQPLGAALRCQHLEGRPAEQKEALCGSLLSLLYTTELGNVTLQLINSLMGCVGWDPLRSRLYLVIYFSNVAILERDQAPVGSVQLL